MMLHPLVKNTVKYVTDNSREGGNLWIRGREAEGVMVLAICCECIGVSGQRTGQVLELEGKRQESPLVRMDQSLKRTFGSDYGIVIGNREDGMPGREMQIRLPLHGENLER
jgi:LytS/YehU family sensor histidine kinase